MKDRYKLIITCSGFGTEEEVKKQYSKQGVERIFDFDDISEFVGMEDEHHSGVYTEIVEIESEKIREFMQNYLSENSMQGECFGIYALDSEDKELLTEENL